jgi:hypothetical protein
MFWRNQHFVIEKIFANIKTDVILLKATTFIFEIPVGSLQ